MSDTLVIKHLPNVLSDNEKEDFLKHFGAKEVKCVTSKHNKYNLVFARFENEKVAENVLHRLHQVNVIGSALSVEFTKNGRINSAQQELSIIRNNSKDEENEKLYKQFIEKLTSWHLGFDFKQPVPSHLKYQYPPPDMQVLSNVVKVLATVPKFYTQVLHLMNKMNLPCPFGKEILPEIELTLFSSQRDKKTTQGLPDEMKLTDEVVETSESEISSDENSIKPKETIPEQYKAKKKTKIKVPKFIKPATATEKPKTKKTKFEEVFEKVSDEREPKKIKLQPLPTKSDDVAPSEPGTGFGFIHPVKKPEEKKPEFEKDTRDEREEERLDKEMVSCISEKELASNRISEKDRSILPVFKNYAEGAATCRLYIKNLAKTVTEQDLRYIYHRYLPASIDSEPNMFDVRLMQEGRMKGQAFVTLQTVDLAQKALKETNGYILKDKPLVVQFARSATKQT